VNALVHELATRVARDPLSVERFLAEHRFPLVEGSTVTFVFRGRADSVALQHWIHGLASQQPFHRVPGTDLWALAMDLPEGSRVEYKLEIARGPQRELILDPLNPQRASDPYGANSVVHAAGYATPDWAEPDPDARPGTIEEHEIASEVFGDRRPLAVYLPARFRPTRRYSLLVLHDGQDYARFAGLKTALDNLIHRLDVQSLVVALIRSPDRLREYADDERHARFLADELLPLLEGRYPLVREPSARCLMGASFGAVASLAAAWRRPGVFGKLFLQSGSFVFTDIGEHGRGPVYDPVVRFMNAFRRAPGRPAEQVFVSCGTYESLIYYNRSLVPLLQSTGMQVRFAEARDGHNWENWRDRLRDGLSWLFPGPLWMVYE
jgi:enterochelin esterase family protein